jgi:hypothetical protein
MKSITSTFLFWEGEPDTTLTDILMKTQALEQRIQVHLSLVYRALALCLTCSALGAIANSYWNFGGLVTFLVTLGIIVYLEFDSDKTAFMRRLFILCIFGFFQGATLGPLLSLAAFLDSSTIITALVCSAAMFICFSITALISPRRETLYLGGFLSSVFMALFLVNMLGMVFTVEAAYSIYLFGGILALAFFVVADTQCIIEVTIPALIILYLSIIVCILC